MSAAPTFEDIRDRFEKARDERAARAIAKASGCSERQSAVILSKLRDDGWKLVRQSCDTTRRLPAMDER